MFLPSQPTWQVLFGFGFFSIDHRYTPFKYISSTVTQFSILEQTLLKM